jgi:hypothetical protein
MRKTGSTYPEIASALDRTRWSVRNKAQLENIKPIREEDI